VSFILDALRKSDQDRQRTSVPGVQTMHAPAAAADKLKVWPYALLIAVAVTGVAIFQWPKSQMNPVAITRGPTHQPETIAEMKLRPSVPEPPLSSAATIEPEAEASRPAPAAVQLSDDFQAPEIAAPENAEPIELEEPVEWIEITPQSPATDTFLDVVETLDEPVVIPNVHALPPSTQRQLPAIAIAAQIYDSDPASRMALINGRSVREGGVIAPGLILESIGENGIVLNFQGQRFHMDVFQNWSGN
jgi:general secretion pathway protein B